MRGPLGNVLIQSNLMQVDDGGIVDNTTGISGYGHRKNHRRIYTDNAQLRHHQENRNLYDLLCCNFKSYESVFS